MMKIYFDVLSLLVHLLLDKVYSFCPLADKQQEMWLLEGHYVPLKKIGKVSLITAKIIKMLLIEWGVWGPWCAWEQIWIPGLLVYSFSYVLPVDWCLNIQPVFMYAQEEPAAPRNDGSSPYFHYSMLITASTHHSSFTVEFTGLKPRHTPLVKVHKWNILIYTCMYLLGHFDRDIWGLRWGVCSRWQPEPHQLCQCGGTLNATRLQATENSQGRVD